MSKSLGLHIPIIILCIITLIILCIYLVKLRPMIERFTTKYDSKNNDHILICIGDSILNNTNYVPNGKSVIDYLQKGMKNMKVINLAQDNANIDDVYNQLRRIPDIKSNHSATTNNNTKTRKTIILSVGGNNLLEYEPIDFVYVKYVDLVSYIKENEDENYKLYVLNLYYPTDESMKKYYERIRKWNEMLDRLPVKYNIDMNVIDISKIIKEPTDLVSKIEPSVTGGLKIAEKIMGSVN